MILPNGEEFHGFGVILAAAIRNRVERSSLSVREPDEDIRATVIGAGTRTTSFSGTTAQLDRSVLPLKNLRVVEAPPVEPDHEYEEITALLRTCLERAEELYDAGEETPFVLYLPSVEPLSYERTTELARAVAGRFRCTVSRRRRNRRFGRRLSRHRRTGVKREDGPRRRQVTRVRDLTLGPTTREEVAVPTHASLRVRVEHPVVFLPFGADDAQTVLASPSACNVRRRVVFSIAVASRLDENTLSVYSGIVDVAG